ncbi:hypothetical protein, variant 2 [Aphanomyces invadans]|uniref:Uncharacterized protein n=1 Tax=Aphanomyces invadans TaxID=157072 RepID=A0A024TQ49_9STRA|nr:hypothetical protein, variant 2 [Aphanomyces invadans]ETV95751.1 hypothetical protein, variant 2 [Aphanomyces invadans]|eukprot:XP_008875500.1 hypothetical protein, variant 2 [Aphanomyces invadans]
MATNVSIAAPAERCTLLNGTFNDLIQVMLGLIALSVLIFKRYHEHPRRPMKIWIFDASKQLIGAGVAHAANLAIAIALTGLAKGRTDADQCAFYFINFTLDTTLGVAVNYVLLKALVLFAVLELSTLQSSSCLWPRSSTVCRRCKCQETMATRSKCGSGPFSSSRGSPSSVPPRS